MKPFDHFACLVAGKFYTVDNFLIKNFVFVDKKSDIVDDGLLPKAVTGSLFELTQIAQLQHNNKKFLSDLVLSRLTQLFV